MMRADLAPEQVERINAALLTAVKSIEAELDASPSVGTRLMSVRYYPPCHQTFCQAAAVGRLIELSITSATVFCLMKILVVILFMKRLK